MKSSLMKMVSGVFAALCASMAWSYGDWDTDANGHVFCDTNYYVQSTKDCGDWGCTALFVSGDYWSDGLAPHAQSTTSPNDYYLSAWKGFTLNAHNGYATQSGDAYINPETGKPFYNRVAVGSLTMAPYAYLALDIRSCDPIEYAYTFNDLRLRPRATLQMSTGSSNRGFCLKGNVKILSEDNSYPAMFMLGNASTPPLSPKQSDRILGCTSAFYR